MFVSRTVVNQLHQTRASTNALSQIKHLTTVVSHRHEKRQSNNELLVQQQQHRVNFVTATTLHSEDDGHEIINRPKSEVFSPKKPACDVQSFVNPPTGVTESNKPAATEIIAAEKSCEAIIEKPPEYDQLLDLNPKSDASHELGLTLETWDFDVSTFGRIKINSPFSVKIMPTNPQDCPEMNKAHISLLANKSWADITLVELSRPALISRCKHLYTASVEVKDGNINFDAQLLENPDKDFTCKLSCIFYLPMKYSVDIEVTGNSNVDLTGLESTNIKINMERGNCKLKNIKSSNLSVSNKQGDVICPTVLYSNIDITAPDGDVKIGKIQASKASINVGVGLLSVKTIYAEQSEFSLLNGNLHVGNCHGNTKFNLGSGTAKIDSSDGDLIGNCKTGDIDVHINRLNNVSLITEQGNINLSVENGLQTALDLEGREITISPELETSEEPSRDGELMVLRGVVKSAGGILKAIAKDGNVHLDNKDWFKTLGIS
ncbi:protein FAM185A-like [Tubulanus polymorphus]|uniref:protein FAM185A-like n=1 Tax=Tubulanus polymorphus TaxID=672921 RepID=UPI003DA41081